MQEGARQKLAAGAASQDAVGAYGDTTSGTGSSVTISGLEFPRYFSTTGTDPFDEVEWELRDAVIGSERGKIVPRRISGVCTPCQRRLSEAIKQARNIALLPFASGSDR